MTIKEMAHRIEDMKNEAVESNSLSEAVYQAIYRGDVEAEYYEGSFMVLRRLIVSLTENLQKLTEDAFQLARGGD